MASRAQAKASAEVSNATTVSATFDSAVTAGNLVVGIAAGWRSSGTTLSGIDDNKGNGAYTVQENDLWNANVRHAQGYKANVGTGGTTFTVTATFDAAVAGTLGLIEYAGVKAAPTVSSVSNSGSSTAADSGTINPTAESVVVASMIYDSASQTMAVTNANYTEVLEIDENNDTQCQNDAERIGTTGSQSCTWSISGAGSPWGAHAVAYDEDRPATLRRVQFDDFPKPKLRSL